MDFRDYVALYVINPNAGRDMLDYARAVAELIRHEFAYIKVFVTSNVDELHRVVTNSHNKCEIVICAGGDGTVNHTLNYMDRENQILGVVPIGSGNDIARNCKYPKNATVKDIADRILQLNPEPTDVCSVNNIFYLNSGGVGFDAVSLLIRQRAPGFLRSNYFVLGGFAALNVPAVDVDIKTSNGYSYSGKIFWTLGMNNIWIGNGMPVTPLAKIDDGLLDMLILKATNRLQLLTSMSSVFSKKHLQKPQIKYLQCQSFSIVFKNKPFNYLALDGEVFPNEEQQLEFKCHSRAIKLLR